MANNLTPKQELFCQLYIRGDKKQFGNATRCYIDAYGIDINVKDKDWTKDEIQSKKNYNTAMATGNANIWKPMIKKRINEILKKTFNDDEMDDELSKIVLQNNDLWSKLAGIKEYNRLKARVIEKTAEVNIYDFSKLTPREMELKRKAILDSK